MRDEQAMLLSLLIEVNGDGYLASVPGIQGAVAEGDTMEGAVFNCIDVVKLIAAYRKERGENLGFNTVAMTPESRLTVAMPLGLGVNA